MSRYVKICEYCDHVNEASDLECRKCSADLTFVNPTKEQEEGNPGKEAPAAEQLCGEGRNTVLPERIKLVACKDGFEIPVPVKAEVVIGREGDVCCDYFSASTYISRRHATIRLNHEGYCITDHSSNGTFINGKLLRRGETGRISVGDRITIADMEFTLMSL